eukprot:356647-Chlamydomonas_euryale.AAC.12
MIVAQVDTVALDKTGTLTMGVLTLTGTRLLVGEDAALDRGATARVGAAADCSCAGGSRDGGGDRGCDALAARRAAVRTGVCAAPSSPAGALSLSRCSSVSEADAATRSSSSDLEADAAAHHGSGSCEPCSSLQADVSNARGSSGGCHGGGGRCSVEGGCHEGGGCQAGAARSVTLSAAAFGADGSIALRCALALARGSSHPVARAVVSAAACAAAGGCAPVPYSVTGFEQVPGLGMQGIVSVGAPLSSPPCQARVRFGSAAFVRAGLPAGGRASDALARDVALSACDAATPASQSYVSIEPCCVAGGSAEGGGSASTGTGDGGCSGKHGEPVEPWLLAALSFEDVVAAGA